MLQTPPQIANSTSAWFLPASAGTSTLPPAAAAPPPPPLPPAAAPAPSRGSSTTTRTTTSDTKQQTSRTKHQTETPQQGHQAPEPHKHHQHRQHKHWHNWPPAQASASSDRKAKFWSSKRGTSGKTKTEVSFGVSFLYRFGYRLGRRYFLTRLGLVKCRDGNDNDINLSILQHRSWKNEMHGHKHMLA